MMNLHRSIALLHLLLSYPHRTGRCDMFAHALAWLAFVLSLSSAVLADTEIRNFRLPLDGPERAPVPNAT